MKIDEALGTQNKLAFQQLDGGGTASNLHDEVLNQTNPNGAAQAQANQNTAMPEATSTGQGVEAAVGTNYSWNQQGQQKAQTQYQADVVTQKQNYLTNRQTIENNAVNYQTQADMMKYQANQNAEKVGWTGGYVLDQNRQMDYLKQGIQAQMYGAMELQKYGYDSALAAARLSYDLNQQEYARQYYQDAVSAALSEAQLTGTYFSAETKDMMAQLHIANAKAEDQSLTEAERTQAKNLSDQIEKWFGQNGISKAGVKTLEAWTQEQANELQWHQQLWAEYNAALETAKNDIMNNATAFIAYDDDGNIKYETGNNGIGNEVKTIDMVGMDASKLFEYMKGQIDLAQANTNLAGFNKRTEQVQSYLNYLKEKAVADNTKTATNADGNQKQTFDKDAYEKTIKEINELITQLNDEYKKATGKTDDIVASDYEPTKPQNADEPEVNPNEGGYKYPVNGEKGTSASLYSGKSTIRGVDQSKGIDNDIDVDFGNGIGTGTKNYNYDLDIDWMCKYTDAGTLFNSVFAANNNDYDNKEWKDINNYLTTNYKVNESGSFVVLKKEEAENLGLRSNHSNATSGDTLWFYYNGRWGYVQNNVGGSRLLEDMITYINGGTPSRWR